MRYVVHGDAKTLEVHGKASFAAPGAEPLLSELSGAVLDALVDEHAVSTDDAHGSPSFRLVKRRSGSR